jgi:hypothetical protein
MVHCSLYKDLFRNLNSAPEILQWCRRNLNRLRKFYNGVTGT